MMRFLITGTAGHLGEALARTLIDRGHRVVGLDLLESPYTTRVGSVCDPDLVRACARDVDFVFHAATLHKPHLATHSRQAFVDTNISGTLNVLEAALAAQVTGVVFTSTTSAFGAALRPAGGEPAAWVTEDVRPVARNIYGVSKIAAEEICELIYRDKGLPCVVLRTSRFFQEADDDASVRDGYQDLNLKVNEFLYRRVDLADAVDAHLLAAQRAADLGFARYIVSATTPFTPEQLGELRENAPALVRDLFPDYQEEYARREWKMFPKIDRVYVNARARKELGWKPRFDFRSVLDRLKRDEPVFSALALAVGSKGYHSQRFDGGPYPVERHAEPGGSAPGSRFS